MAKLINIEEKWGNLIKVKKNYQNLKILNETQEFLRKLKNKNFIGGNWQY